MHEGFSSASNARTATLFAFLNLATGCDGLLPQPICYLQLTRWDE